MTAICKICGTGLSHGFKTMVLGKHDADYCFCKKCGFICAENPYWLEEAYSSAISTTDTGLVERNVAIADKLSVILYFLMGERGMGHYVDVAGGYGMLTRLMRDQGFDYYWADKYCQNLLAHGFDYTPDIGACRAVTAFEVLEHTEDPISFVEETLKYYQTETLIFTTELYNGNPPSPDQWWYYSFETGQHIAFFQNRTLRVLATRMGLNFSSNGWLHIISKNKINEALLGAYTGRLSILATHWLKRNLIKRTMIDHNILVDQLKRNKL